MAHTIRLIRLKFIDTAEDEATWMLNVKKQWEGTSKISLRVLAGNKVIGITPPKMLQWYPYTGMSWETECATGATFPVDFSSESPNVLFEVVGLAKPPGTVLGLVFWSAESFIGSGIQYTRQTLHVFRTGSTVKKHRDDCTVHAVIEVEVKAASPPSTPRSLAAALLRAAGAGGSPAAGGLNTSQADSDSPFDDLGVGVGGSSTSSSPAGGPQGVLTAAAIKNLRKSYRQSYSAAGLNMYAFSSSPTSVMNAAPGVSSNAHLTTDMPLSYTFGMVRTSVLDLYFPNQLLSDGTTIAPSVALANSMANGVGNNSLAVSSSGGVVATPLSSTSPTMPSVPKTPLSTTLATVSLGGSIIVSNVICVANLSEKVNLSMQLVARGAGGDQTASALVFNPPGGVIVLPNQRAFFSVTWNSDMPLSAHLVEDVQLLLSGPDVSPPPVTFRVHFSDPKNNELYAPYHYWANGTLITNRPLNTHRELPFIRAVLPVFMLQQEMLNGLGGGAGSGHSRQGSEYLSSPYADDDLADDGLLVRDADTGLHRRVVSSGAVGPALLPDGTKLSASIGSGAGNSGRTSPAAQNSSAAAAGPAKLMKQLAVRSWRGEYARCTLRLGTLFGFPMMTSSSTREGMAPSFKIMAQLLATGGAAGGSNAAADGSTTTAAAAAAADGNNGGGMFGGWALEDDSDIETQEVYQTLSGNLRWSTDDKLVLRKAPNATLAQFLRLTLIECTALDRDETPIAAAIVSLPTDTASSLQPVPLFIAFYVFDTFSLFDQLPTSSLVMKGATMKFSAVRSAKKA